MSRLFSLVALLSCCFVVSSAQAGVLIWVNGSPVVVSTPDDVTHAVAGQETQKSTDEEGSSAFSWLDELVGELAELVGGK